MGISIRQVELMTHALGGDFSGNGRNHYCTSDSSGDWVDLVSKGFATKKESSMLPIGIVYFHVTEKGMDYLRTIKKSLEK